MTDHSANSANKPHLQLSLSGLHCQGCANRVKTTLEALPEVLSATVSADLNNCDVELHAAPVNPAQLVETIKGLGFSATYTN